jgi:ribosomal protein L3 glutamine methyltransferase
MFSIRRVIQAPISLIRPFASQKSKGVKREQNGSVAEKVQVISSQLSTVFDVYRYAVSAFSKNDLSYGHSTTTPWEDASFLIMHELHLPFSDPITHWGNAKLLSSEREHLVSLIQQRIQTKKPTPYLVKGCYQQGEYFYVDERVLVPRSYIGEILKNPALIGHNDTTPSPISTAANSIMIGSENGMELDYGDYIGEIVDESKVQNSLHNHSPWHSTPSTPRSFYDPTKIRNVLDLCCGSGCLAILAAKYFPNIERVDAVDISQDALGVAAMNIEMKQLEDIVHLHHGNLYDALPKDPRTQQPLHKYDLIISNPPYVTVEDMEYLPEEYRHEPRIALEAGKDGLSVVRKIVHKAGMYLAEEESGLLCEIGQCKEAFVKAFGKQLDSSPSSKQSKPGLGMSEQKIHWIATSNSKDEVFFMKKKYLLDWSNSKI